MSEAKREALLKAAGLTRRYTVITKPKPKPKAKP